jgi:hypothetical protein
MGGEAAGIATVGAATGCDGAALETAMTVGGGAAPIRTVGDDGWIMIGVDGKATDTGDWDGAE